jgi:transposase
MQFVGIDVSAKSLAVSVSSANGNKTGEFKNTPIGYKKILKFISLKNNPVRVCMEATGVYHFDLALFLKEQPNVDVMIINPKISKNFAITLNRQNKDDLVDAEILAEFCSRMEFVSWKKPSPEALKIRAFARHLSRLTHRIVQTKNELHAISSSIEMEQKEIIKSIKKILHVYDREADKILQMALDFIASVPDLQRVFELLCEITGIGEKTAILLLGELLVLPDGLTHKQWVKHAGLNPCHFRSGTSVYRRAHISRSGNRNLRNALYMPALCATRYDPYVRGFYAHLIQDQQLKKKQALCAVMRKLLHAVHGVLTTGQSYDNTRFFEKPFEGPIEIKVRN